MTRLLAIVTARGGSRRLPGKNLMPLQGRTLLERCLDTARAARSVDRTIVSSEDPAIIAAALAAGADVPFVRPRALATDAVDAAAVALHALDCIDGPCDLFVLLQPTSPLRTAADIDRAVRLCRDRNAPACVSVTAAPKPPAWLHRVTGDGRLAPLFDSDPGPAVLPNGAIYLARPAWFRRHRRFLHPETVCYPMPRERSVDIDDATDFRIAGLLLEQNAHDRSDRHPRITQPGASP